MLFPIFLKVETLRILIVGGGNVAAEKLFFLLKSSPNARPEIISRDLNPRVRSILADHPQVRIQQKAVEEKDFEQRDIIILATGNAGVDSDLLKKAKAHRALVNVADTPEACDFYLGSIVTKGDLKIAISSNGKSPTLSRKFRILLEDLLPEELPQVIKNLHQIRKKLKGDLTYKIKKLNEITSILN